LSFLSLTEQPALSLPFFPSKGKREREREEAKQSLSLFSAMLPLLPLTLWLAEPLWVLRRKAKKEERREKKDLSKG